MFFLLCSENTFSFTPQRKLERFPIAHPDSVTSEPNKFTRFRALGWIQRLVFLAGDPRTRNNPRGPPRVLWGLSCWRLLQSPQTLARPITQSVIAWPSELTRFVNQLPKKNNGRLFLRSFSSFYCDKLFVYKCTFAALFRQQKLFGYFNCIICPIYLLKHFLRKYAIKSF